MAPQGIALNFSTAADNSSRRHRATRQMQEIDCTVSAGHDVENKPGYAIAVTDTRTPDQRRRIMQSVGSKDTGPEWLVRRLLFSSGYRYRLHRRDLPGSPDIVFQGRRKAIFVHGCFWHGHGCLKGRAPKSRTEYWGAKIAANRARDERNLMALHTLGWETLVLWQCELGDEQVLIQRLVSFVDRATISIDKRTTSS